MTENQPLNYHTLALDVQQLTKASRHISTVLRVEGMDLEIGSRRLLREARDAIDAAIAAQQPTQVIAIRRVPLSDKAVEQLICTNHFDPKYQLKESDRTVLAWYRLGLRDGERAHGIAAQQGDAA